jgi:hypothetical protein
MFWPGLLIDEADKFLRDNEELRGVLNSGHRRGGSVLHTTGDDHEPRSFATYAACVIALIGPAGDALVVGNIVVEVEIGDAGGGRCLEGPPRGLSEWEKAGRLYITTIAGQIAAARRFGPIGFTNCWSDSTFSRVSAHNLMPRSVPACGGRPSGSSTTTGPRSA